MQPVHVRAELQAGVDMAWRTVFYLVFLGYILLVIWLAGFFQACQKIIVVQGDTPNVEDDADRGIINVDKENSDTLTNDGDVDRTVDAPDKLRSKIKSGAASSSDAK